MGCDSTNTLSKTAKKKDVQDFLSILGYIEYSHNYYIYYDRKGKEQVSGVSASISNDSPIKVHTHTTTSRSIKDHEIHNWTIKQLRNRFGGVFNSDFGQNRYLQFDGTIRREAEAGCYSAYFDFLNNIATIHGFLMIVKKSENDFPIIDSFKEINPLISTTNIGLPFMISILEEYLRSTYISILMYSSNKKDIFKKSNIQTEELIEVTENNLAIEELISRFKSFQSVELINKHFKELNSELSFLDTLIRNNPRIKYADRLNAIISKRHKLIHRFQMDYDYTIKEFEKDLEIIEEIVHLFYDRIIEIHKWIERDE